MLDVRCSMFIRFPALKQLALYEILVENGFTADEAIASGTTVASKVVKRMNGQDNFGVILPGKRADLILLKQNPLEDVANTRKIIGVMAAGRWYDRKALAAMIAQ